jgi:DNA-binding transcriptional ArsR family regulator
MNEELVAFFKALADANRLKIVGLLAQRPYSGEELAALLDLKPSTVSHHLSKLAEVGLVSARAQGE